MIADTSEAGKLSEISRELEQASSRLASGGLDEARASELASHCAQLAAEAAIELDRVARTAPGASLPGQEELL